MYVRPTGGLTRSRTWGRYSKGSTVRVGGQCPPRRERETASCRKLPAVPIDPHAFDEGELDPADASGRFREFECPVCSAHNPYDDGFGGGDEIRCFYCGQDFKVSVSAGGALKLREL